MSALPSFINGLGRKCQRDFVGGQDGRESHSLNVPAKRSAVVEEQNYSSCSHNFPGHNERYAGHMKRIRTYLRAHRAEAHGAALEKSTMEG